MSDKLKSHIRPDCGISWICGISVDQQDKSNFMDLRQNEMFCSKAASYGTWKLQLIRANCTALLHCHTITHHNKDATLTKPASLFSASSIHLLLLFQSLLTGLMYYRPDDPIDFLESCLKKARELGGPEKVRWDTFVGQEKKSLPPLNGGQSRRSLFRNGEKIQHNNTK